VTPAARRGLWGLAAGRLRIGFPVGRRPLTDRRPRVAGGTEGEG
jgi:hypothetical protein